MAVAVMLVAILLFVALDDLSNFRIQNVAVLMLVCLFVVQCLSYGSTQDLWTHAIYAAAVAVVALAAFHLRVIGGGDAKLMIAAAFWLGLDKSSLFAILLLVAAITYGLGARIGILPVRRSGGRIFIPFGPCIAAAWLGTLGLLKSL